MRWAMFSATMPDKIESLAKTLLKNPVNVKRKMIEWMKHPEKADPRMHPEMNPMPFDGKRMIFGGFTPLVELVSSSGKKASS